MAQIESGRGTPLGLLLSGVGGRPLVGGAPLRQVAQVHTPVAPPVVTTSAPVPDRAPPPPVTTPTVVLPSAQELANRRKLANDPDAFGVPTDPDAPVLMPGPFSQYVTRRVLQLRGIDTTKPLEVQANQLAKQLVNEATGANVILAAPLYAKQKLTQILASRAATYTQDVLAGTAVGQTQALLQFHLDNVRPAAQLAGVKVPDKVILPPIPIGTPPRMARQIAIAQSQAAAVGPLYDRLLAAQNRLNSAIAAKAVEAIDSRLTPLASSDFPAKPPDVPAPGSPVKANPAEKELVAAIVEASQAIEAATLFAATGLAPPVERPLADGVLHQTRLPFGAAPDP